MVPEKIRKEKARLHVHVWVPPAFASPKTASLTTFKALAPKSFIFIKPEGPRVVQKGGDTQELLDDLH